MLRRARPQPFEAVAIIDNFNRDVDSSFFHVFHIHLPLPLLPAFCSFVRPAFGASVDVEYAVEESGGTTKRAAGCRFAHLGFGLWFSIHTYPALLLLNQIETTQQRAGLKETNVVPKSR